MGKRGVRNRALIEVHTKIANILIKFDNLMRDAGEEGRAIAGVEAMRRKVKEIQQTMLRRM